MSVETVIVGGGEGPVRLDRWFRRHYPGLAHARLEKLLRTGQIRVDGRRARAGDRLEPGQAIRIPPLGNSPLGETPPAPPAGQPPDQLRGLKAHRGPKVNARELRPPAPEDAAMLHRAILHRDDALIVLDKPPGLAVQGGTRTERHIDALLDALRFGAAERPRLVHRLDKDTSGVLVIARTAAAAGFLARAFRDKRTRKVYWAIVVGVPKLPRGRIDLALAKTPGHGPGQGGAHGGERVRASAEEGRRAVTYYRLIDSAGARASWLALLPVTGRTHQLRAHCAAIGTPILGDGKYGGALAHLAGVPGARRLHLHARALSIPHPAGGTLAVTAPLPLHMRQSWEFFGFARDVEDPFAELDL